VEGWINEFTRHVTLSEPWCPFCRSAMKLRKGRVGLFWGCSRDSDGCKGQRNARPELLGDRKNMPV
jgi:ssDNA-binding Zn-finger/Zn-ribbon topoisomerase 1